MLKCLNETVGLGCRLKCVNETVSTVMLVLVALLPGLMAFSPESYGIAFKLLGKVEIVTLIVLGLVNLLVAYVKGKKDGRTGMTKEIIRKIYGAFAANRHFLLLLIAFVIAFVSACLASDTENAFYGSDFRPDGFFMYAFFAGIFIFGSCIRDQKLKNLIYGVYIFSFVLNGIIVLQQYLGVLGSVREDSCPVWLEFLKNFYDDIDIRTGFFYKGITGAFYNSNHAGYFLMMSAMVVSALLALSKRKSNCVVFAVLCAFSLWLVIVNDTFGVYIAAFVTLALLTVFAWIRTRKSEHFVRSCIPVVLLVVLSVIVTLTGSKTVLSNIINLKNDIQDISSENEDAHNAGSGRWELWVATADMISDRPLIGYGPDNVNSEYEKRNLDMSRAHNEYLEHPLNCGIPFAVFYLSGIFYIVFRRVRNMRTYSDARKYLVPLMVCVGYMISAFTGVFLFYTACHFFVMLSLLKD